MITYDVGCWTLARRFLRDYDLSAEEYTQEATLLAQMFQQVAEDHLENLAHRRRP